MTAGEQSKNAAVVILIHTSTYLVIFVFTYQYIIFPDILSEVGTDKKPETFMEIPHSVLHF